MATTMTGQFTNDMRLKVLNNALKGASHGLSNWYLGFATATISKTDTLAAITESADLARVDLAGKLADAALDGGIPKIKNSALIESGNATTSEALTSWFITDAASGTTGTVVAFGNTTGEALNTNVGEAVTIAENALVITSNDPA